MAEQRAFPTPTKEEQEQQQRQLGELLQELRVALPGVQILVAFLLTVPFQQRFGDVTPFQKTVYFVALLTAVASVAFMIAPSASHRVLFHQHQRHWIIERSNAMALAGLGFLAIAMTAVVVLITDRLYDGPAVWVVGGGAAVLFAGLWYVIPFARRVRARRESDM